MPMPPAMVEMRNNRPRVLSGSLNDLISAVRCLIGTLPRRRASMATEFSGDEATFTIHSKVIETFGPFRRRCSRTPTCQPLFDVVQRQNASSEYQEFIPDGLAFVQNRSKQFEFPRQFNLQRSPRGERRASSGILRRIGIVRHRTYHTTILSSWLSSPHPSGRDSSHRRRRRRHSHRWHWRNTYWRPNENTPQWKRISSLAFVNAIPLRSRQGHPNRPERTDLLPRDLDLSSIYGNHRWNEVWAATGASGMNGWKRSAKEGDHCLPSRSSSDTDNHRAVWPYLMKWPWQVFPHEKDVTQSGRWIDILN